MPGEVEGAMCFSGRFPSEFLSAVAARTRLAGVTIWVSHGREDPAIPIQFGRAVQVLLERLEVNHTYREYEAGHEMTHAMLTDAGLWLNRQLASLSDDSLLPAPPEAAPQT